jgi:phage-related protein (TIGR01555 family)
MPKKSTKKRTPSKTIVAKNATVLPPAEIQKESRLMIQNGLTEALLGFNPGSIGVELSQVDTLFKNNRWYLISNMRQLLSEIYVEHGLVQTIVDVPVDDGLRGGILFKSEQLSPEQIEELRVYFEREDIIGSVVGQALKWNRLYGGAGILVITDQDPMTPLDLDAITEDSPVEYRAVDMWELFWDKQNVEGYDATIQEHEFEHYSYYGMKIHKSRVLRLKGLTAPSFIRPRLRGWGFSIVESLVRSINQYLKENDLVFEVLDEFKLDIFKIEGLAGTLLAPDGEQKVRQRVQLANQQKNFQNAMTMDAKDDYVQKQLSFSGLAEIMKEIRMQIASDMRMPLTKIFGISAAGFSSGEDDIENYNAMVESQVRAKCKYEILQLAGVACRKLFGFVPDDLTGEFKPLRILSAEQEENVKTQKFNRVLAAKQANEITTKEFRDSCNKDNLLPVQLDTELDTLDELATEKVSDVEGGENGANEEDKKKPQLSAKGSKSTIAAKDAPEAKD